MRPVRFSFRPGRVGAALCAAFILAACGGSRSRSHREYIRQRQQVVSPSRDVREPVSAREDGGIAGRGFREKNADEQSVLQDIFFEYNRYGLHADAMAVLARIADYLKTRPTLTLVIEGHCDARGSEEYNLALGERRASAVQRVLVDYGIKPDRLQVISFGEERPLSDGTTEADYAKDRRVHFEIRDK